nr:uncharacterized mitochondrial protein AtMg00810-like [Nicotiana tomentosiformis]
MHAPTSAHLSAGFHVLQYVKGTLGQGLFMAVGPDFTFQAYCDSNWASCPTFRSFVSGYLVLFGGSIITWKSKKQHIVALSSAAAEYHSMQRVVAELASLLDYFMSCLLFLCKLQLADMLTKPLSGVTHQFILNKLGVSNHSPT